jgi:predicted transcriptional regulator
MPAFTQKNFHVPLPPDIYEALHAEARHTQQPATQIARAAIAAWLAQQRKTRQHEAVASYARQQASTPDDLDPALEAAGIEHLASNEDTSP